MSEVRKYRSRTAQQLQLDGVELASFRSRVIAIGIDGLIVALLLAIMPVVVALRDGVASGSPGERQLAFEIGSSLGSFAVMVAYFGIATWLGRGATPGKRLTGIRVVSLAHEHVSLWHSIERALGYAASALEAGFGFVQYFIHPNCQTVHDRIAETIVVKVR